MRPVLRLSVVGVRFAQTGWDVFTLEYVLTAPLTTVFTPDVMARTQCSRVGLQARLSAVTQPCARSPARGPAHARRRWRFLSRWF